MPQPGAGEKLSLYCHHRKGQFIAPPRVKISHASSRLLCAFPTFLSYNVGASSSSPSTLYFFFCFFLLLREKSSDAQRKLAARRGPFEYYSAAGVQRIRESLQLPRGKLGCLEVFRIYSDLSSFPGDSDSFSAGEEVARVSGALEF